MSLRRLTKTRQSTIMFENHLVPYQAFTDLFVDSLCVNFTGILGRVTRELSY